MAPVRPSLRSRILKVFLVETGVLIIIVLALQLWFIYNARSVLKQYITEQSGGRIKLELSELYLNLLSKRLQIEEADLISTDSLSEPITYHVTFKKISLRVGSLWQLLVHNRLYLDSLKLYDPVIEVIQWRKDTGQVVIKDELSIPQEMGKFYTSLLNALDKFSVRRVVIDNAKVSLINKIKPGSEPVTVSNIFFNLVRSPVRQNNEDVYLKSHQRVELRTSYQNIVLPGGRHHLSFKSFRLQLFGERIDLDSCTVTAMPTDSSKSSYRIFFKKLSLTGVDYAAMSAKNVIKADSVYCENPFFDLDLFRSDAVKNKTEIPDPNKLIRELTGNLDLAFVGVQNAGIHFDIHDKTKRSFFNSNKDNFQIHGFRVHPDSAEPVSVRRFDMTLRDYRLYNEDSSSIYSFDRLHFLNDRIVLNNFSILNRPGSNKIRNEIDIRVPYFELSQLDWYKLIFEQNMVAKEAVLNNPVINFTRHKTGAAGKKLNLFAALQNLDSLVALENVTVVNGSMNMTLGPSTSFNVQNLDFNLYSNKLLSSVNKEGLRSAVEHLSFSNGVLRLKDITAQLRNARFTGNNIVYADRVAISGNGDKIVAAVNDVYINNLQLDDDAETIDVDGFGWKSATVALKALPIGNNAGNGNSRIHLRNIEGNNTQLNFSNGPLAVSTYVNTLNASSILKKGDDLIQVEGFKIAGNNLLVNSKAVKINAVAYNISGSDSSSLTGLQVRRIQGRDSLNIRSSLVNFSTDLNDLFSNDLHLSNLQAKALVITLSKWDTATVTATRDSTITPPIRIDRLTSIEPDITVSTHRSDSVTVVSFPWSANSIVQASDIILAQEGMEIGWLLVNTTAATWIKNTGEVFGIEKGKIDMELSNIRFGKKDGKINWSGSVNNLSLQNAKGLGIGRNKSNLHFEKASTGNLNLSSDYLPDFQQLMKANVSAWLRIPQGQYIDSNKTLQWYNATYNNSNRSLSLDSFIYHPTQPLDSVLAHAPYQLDYITVKTGGVRIDGLDVARYEKDSSFIANTISIADPVLTVYRDKKPPFSPGKRDKPLPVNMIRNISLPVSVQSIHLENGRITYSEKSRKSRGEGSVLLTRIGGTLENIKNTNLSDDDSLSLTLQARFMDSAAVHLNIKESYSDSLSGFLLTAKIKSADLSIINPVLVPLTDIKITSGILDSVSLRAVGRQDVSLGEMSLHYRRLRLRFVKNGDPNKSTLVQRAFSILANGLAVKSSNSKRKGIIYLKHSPDQSFVNYVVQTCLSGVMSTIGVKKNSKYIKSYNRELKDSGMPPIEL